MALYCIAFQITNSQETPKMGKCLNVSFSSWTSVRLREIFESWDVYDFLSLLLQIPLQTLFLLGTLLLTVQVMWMKLRPIHPPAERTSPRSTPTKQRNMTLKELSRHNGVDKPNIYTAVHGKVFDVSSSKNSYGASGTFSTFAGRDASRALATFSLGTSNHRGMDDLSDLNPLQMDNLLEWEMQYLERYPCIGLLVKSHQPNSLQTVCLAEICTAMRECSGDEKNVDSLPLPRTMKNKLLNHSRKTENLHL